MINYLTSTVVFILNEVLQNSTASQLNSYFYKLRWTNLNSIIKSKMKNYFMERLNLQSNNYVPALHSTDPVVLVDLTVVPYRKVNVDR